MAEEKNLKPIPVGQGEKTSAISLGTNSLAKMIGSQVAPKANATSVITMAQSVHDHFFTRMGVMTGGNADAALEAAAASRSVSAAATPSGQGRTMFAVGRTVYDVERERKATLVALNVGRTKKGTPIHELIDSRGNAWRQKETKLK